MNKKTKGILDGRIWINLGDDAHIGVGKIELMKLIRQLGSLRKAALEMKMSYRQAWYQIDKINSAAASPLVVLNRGGKEGGIAEITSEGARIIEVYEEIKKDFDIFLHEASAKIQSI